MTAAFRGRTFQVACCWVRQQLQEKDVSDEGRQNTLRRGDTRMVQRPSGAGVVQTSDDALRKPLDMVGVGQESGSGGGPTDETREPPMASPRLIPVPDSPHLSIQLPPDSVVEDTGKTSASFDRDCAPSQAPVSDNANYAQLPYDELHELWKQRGYHKRDTKVVLRTRLEAMDAAAKRSAAGSSNDTDTPMTVLGKRPRATGGTMGMGTEVGGNNSEKRPRGAALEIALSVDL